MAARINIDIEDSIDVVQPFLNQMEWSDVNQPGHVFIAPVKGCLIDPNIYLDISFYVERIDASGKKHAIADNDKVCLANYPINSLWKSKDVYVRGVPVMPASTMTAYTEYIRVMQDKDGRESTLSRSLWAPDKSGRHNNFSPVDTNDPTDPYNIRHDTIIEHRSVDLYGPMLLDIFRTDQPFPDDVDIRIMLHRHLPSLVLNGEALPPGEQYSIVITRANVCYKRLKMRQGEDLYKKAGQQGVLRYPFTCLTSTFNPIMNKQATFSFDVINSSTLPNIIIFAFIDQDAFMEKLDGNPYEFLHCGLKSVFLRKNQSISIPAVPYTTKLVSVPIQQVIRPSTPDEQPEEEASSSKRRRKRDLAMPLMLNAYVGYNEEKALEKVKQATTLDEAAKALEEAQPQEPQLRNAVMAAITDYSRLFIESTRVLASLGEGRNTNFGISYDDYAHGSFLIPFDLRAGKTPKTDNRVMIPATGTLRLEAQFHYALEKPIVVLCLSEQQKMLNIPQAGKGDVFIE